MSSATLGLATDLARRGAPFVLATVLSRRRPTSGQEGAKAVVLADGSVRGWLGGACAQPIAVRESLASLADGRPRHLFIGAPGETGGGVPHGATVVAMTCASEGALEVFLEPILPRPHVVAIGRSPAVDTLATLALGLGWRATIVDEGGSPDGHPAGIAVLDVLELGPLECGPHTCLVVATQGHYDEDALEAALATPAGYIGLVASRRRGAQVLDALRARGVDEAALGRVETPAGLDLGEIEHEEMAVAILARLVAARAAGALRAGVVPERPEEAIDPVCAMRVDPATARFHAEFGGQRYYFCAAGCRDRFVADPAAFAGARA